MLKHYVWRGSEWQFEEGEQPKEAIELKPAEKKAVEPQDKAVKPANKARRTRGK